MAGTRIEVAIRYTPDRSGLSVTYPSGGSTTALTLTGGAIDYTLSDVASRLQTALQTVDAGFTVSVSAGVFTVAHGSSDFDIAWTRPALRDALGFSANLSAATSASGSESPHHCAMAGHWHAEPVVSYHLRAVKGQERTAGAVYLGRSRRWRVTSGWVLDSELDQLRGVLDLMASGIPASWYRDGSTTTAWDWTEYGGRDVVVLSRPAYGDNWASGHAQVVQSLSLEFTAWAP